MLTAKPTIASFIKMKNFFGSNIFSVFFIASLVIEIWGRPFIFDGEYFWFEKPKNKISIYDWWSLRYNSIYCLYWIIFSFFIVAIKTDIIGIQYQLLCQYQLSLHYQLIELKVKNYSRLS